LFTFIGQAQEFKIFQRKGLAAIFSFGDNSLLSGRGDLNIEFNNTRCDEIIPGL
jgi:hypothetical protein